MECHKCQYSASVKAGTYDRIPWEKTPCARCGLEEKSTYTLCYDERRDKRTVGPVCSLDPEQGIETVSGDNVIKLIDFLCEIQPAELEVIRRRLDNETYEQIARAMRTSKSRVEWLQKRACERWPQLWALFPVKVARARKHAKSSEDQEAKKAICITAPGRTRRRYKWRTSRKNQGKKVLGEKSAA